MQRSRSRHDRRRVVTLLVGLAALIVMALSATPSMAESQGDGGSRSCYPDNEYVYHNNWGSTKVSSKGTGTFDESELEYQPTTYIDYVGGKVQWALTGKVVQTASTKSLSGDLDLRVNFDNGEKVRFTSRCAAEVQSTYEGGSGKTGGIELEVEGTVKGFPADPTVLSNAFYSPGQDAVATARILPDGEVAFGIELGSTCYEGWPNNETEIGFHTENTDLATQAPNKDIGRWAFPSGRNPWNCGGAF